MLYASIPCDTRNIYHEFAGAASTKIGGILDLKSRVPGCDLFSFLEIPRGVFDHKDCRVATSGIMHAPYATPRRGLVAACSCSSCLEMVGTLQCVAVSS